ncbi:MAG: alpha/beta fold hydrolase [Thermomicrobiales bacterium]|nr:alpha/beta fold hydrolase [Thermomicrobiales bacterium]
MSHAESQPMPCPGHAPGSLTRRSALRQGAAGVAAAAIAAAGSATMWSGDARAQSSTPSATPASAVDPTLDQIAFASSMDGQFIRALDTIPYRGADVGESFITARRIPDGDTEAWYREWWALAERTEGYANEALAAGNIVSARDAFLRACTYYRQASLYLFKPPLRQGLVDSFANQRRVFVQAMALFDRPGEAIEIPYETTTLPGYLFLPANREEPLPLLIITGGYDGTREESWFAGGAAAIERGWACLVFDGPGQGEALVEQNLFFRHDWEAVVTPVVDVALQRSEIDPNRIALMGRSWGGYLAPRAATAEHRIGAVIADAAQYSPGERAVMMLPEELRPLLASGEDDAALSAWLESAVAASPEVAFSMNRGMLTHGVATPLEYLRGYEPYTLSGIADQIQCPALIIEGEADFRGGDAKPLYDAITSPGSAYLLFSNTDGAGLHDESGAASLFALRVFNWLNGVFDLG